jgi:hypothetical protein
LLFGVADKQTSATPGLSKINLGKHPGAFE